VDEGPRSPFRCAACGFTLFFNAAIATAVFIRRADGRVLFIRRARDPGKGLLAPPGGFVDIGERAEDAVRREVREEVGLELAAVEFLGSFPNAYLYREVTYPVLDFFFTAVAVRPEAARSLDDVAGLAWLDPGSEVAPEQLAFPSMRQALQLLRAQGR
jgi:ADP-ribose pyrophosphatase YjhB (NUDIX family)